MWQCFFTGTLISQGELTDEGLQQRVYEERHSQGVRHLSFEGADVKFDDGSTTAKPLGLQDTASQFVELARRFSTGRQALVVGAEVQLWLARLHPACNTCPFAYALIWGMIITPIC